jgi:hypothetical protein
MARSSLATAAASMITFIATTVASSQTRPADLTCEFRLAEGRMAVVVTNRGRVAIPANSRYLIRLYPKVPTLPPQNVVQTFAYRTTPGSADFFYLPNLQLYRGCSAELLSPEPPSALSHRP